MAQEINKPQTEVEEIVEIDISLPNAAASLIRGGDVVCEGGAEGYMG